MKCLKAFVNPKLLLSCPDCHQEYPIKEVQECQKKTVSSRLYKILREILDLRQEGGNGGGGVQHSPAVKFATLIQLSRV